MFIGNKKPF